MGCRNIVYFYTTLLLLLVACWGAHVAISHQAPLEGDALTGLAASVALRDAISEPTAAAFSRWIWLTNYSPPLPSLLYQPLMHLMCWVLPILLEKEISYLRGGYYQLLASHLKKRSNLITT